jgi:hypothetical protein
MDKVQGKMLTNGPCTFHSQKEIQITNILKNNFIRNRMAKNAKVGNAPGHDSGRNWAPSPTGGGSA